jgi:hypothetical protein
MMYRAFALCAAAAAAAAPGQSVEVANFGAARFEGWIRTTIDEPVVASGEAEGVAWRVGRACGADVRVIDLRVTLEPGERRKVVLISENDGTDRAREAGGAASSRAGATAFAAPVVAGTSLELATHSVARRPNPLEDGAAILTHWRGRLASDARLHADVWLRAYPGQPWAVGELVLCASHADLDGWQVPIEADLHLGVPGAVVLIDGLQLGQPLLRAGDWLADGQARSWRFVVGHLGQMSTADMHSALLEADHAVVARGVATPTYLGAVAPTSEDQRPWIAQHWQGARARLHGWDAGPLGPAANSGRTGAQEDQGAAKGSRAYGPGGLGAEVIRYYVALGGSRRPCHHLEASGDRLRPDRADLVLWDGRPHWSRSVSPDQLGLSEQPTQGWRTHGWWGPDRQHWFINTLALAAELTGSPALQWQLEHQATLWRYQETVDPALATSRADAARSQGWAGIVAAQLWHALEDRQLALEVAERWHLRVATVYVPTWRQRGLWDLQTDARVTQYVDRARYPYVTMAYQAAFATMGVTLGLQGFPPSVPGITEARELAYRQALLVLDQAYDAESRGWEIVGVESDGRTLAGDLVEGVSAHRTGWFDDAWLPCCAWTVLQSDPNNPRALEVYERATSGTAPNDWMPPR